MKEEKNLKNEKDLEMSNKEMDISRKEALKKIGTFGKHAAFVSLSTYMILTPMKGQAQSAVAGSGGSSGSGPENLGTGFPE